MYFSWCDLAPGLHQDHISSHLILSHCSIGVVRPPQRTTVARTMIIVADTMYCRGNVDVFRIARAKAMAPRKPGERNITTLLVTRRDISPLPGERYSYRFLCTYIVKISEYLNLLLIWNYLIDIQIYLTWEHHHVLEVPANLVGSSQVQQEGQRVHIQKSTNDYSELEDS